MFVVNRYVARMTMKFNTDPGVPHTSILVFCAVFSMFHAILVCEEPTYRLWKSFWSTM